MDHLWFLLASSALARAFPNKALLDATSSSATNFFFCNAPNSAGSVADQCQETTAVNSAGLTVIANTDGDITLASGVTTPITTTFSDGDTTTITPLNIVIETTDSAGETVFYNGETAITLSTGITTPIKTILPNGESTTIKPGSTTSTTLVTTNPAGHTVISDTDGVITLPTGVTTPIATTFPDGVTTTINPNKTTTQTNPSSSSGVAGAVIIPVTTSVSAPKLTNGGVIVPCDFFWFFDLCPHWDDVKIGGWFIKTPPGIHPPGPPPAFQPDATFSYSIPKPLPDWPQWTLPPSGTPQASPKPQNCHTDTGEICFYDTTFSAVTTSQATTTTSQVFSTCATVFGCDVADQTVSTSTSVSGTPTILTYVVYPTDGNNQAQVTAIAEQLAKFVDELSEVQSFNTESFGFDYWLLPLAEASVASVRNIPNVGSVRAECGFVCPLDAKCDHSCYDPSTANVYQSPSYPQLTDVSWSSTQANRLHRYTFDDSAGEGVPVYIVDTGATLSHDEFNLVRDKTRWLFAAPDRDGTTPHTDGQNSRHSYHGTSMLSLVTGQTLGVAKKVNPILVRLPTSWTDEGRYRGFTPEDWLTGIGMILTDLGNQRQDQASSVVLLADYYPRSGVFETHEDLQSFVHRNWAQLDELEKRGAVVVTGAGNIARDSNQDLDGWPANFGKTDSGVFSLPSLIVAGAIWERNEQTIYKGPTAGIPHVYAPGILIKIADGTPGRNGAYKENSQGTSDSSAMVAGLAANFIRLAQLGSLNKPDGTSVDKSPLGIKNFIIEQAWSRYNTGRNGIFNAIDPNQNTCPWNPNSGNQRLFRRDDDNQCIIPYVPFGKQELVCHDKANYPGHADVLESAVLANANAACERWTGYPYGSQDTKLGPNSSRRNHTYVTDGVTYEYSVEWSDECTTSTISESVYNPTGSDDPKQQCLHLWYSCYKKCHNTGVGGSVTIRCLKYTFTGGK